MFSYLLDFYQINLFENFEASATDVFLKHSCIYQNNFSKEEPRAAVSVFNLV